MSEMITRASDAIAKIRNAGDFGYRATDCELARAAIEAMREPTMHMKQEAGDSIVVGCCNLQLRDARDVWTVMIDAALQDEAP